MVPKPRQTTAGSGATQADVARVAEVHQGTVSRALDPRKRHTVSPDTVLRVEEVARSLGYAPNLFARGLRTKRSNLVGLSVSDMTDPQQAAFATALSERLAALGATLVVADRRLQGGDGAGLRSALVDGTVQLSWSAGEPEVESSCVVRVSHSREMTPDILIDEADGVRLAVEHLRRLGHRRVGFIVEPGATLRGRALRNAFTSAARTWGIEGAVVTHQPQRPASALEATSHLIYARERPTAVFITSDQAAVAGYSAIRRAGLDVPVDLSVVALGESALARYIDPPLTTIATPMRAAGIHAADLVMERIGGAPSDRGIHLRPHLVQRASTARTASAADRPR